VAVQYWGWIIRGLTDKWRSEEDGVAVDVQMTRTGRRAHAGAERRSGGARHLAALALIVAGCLAGPAAAADPAASAATAPVAGADPTPAPAATAAPAAANGTAPTTNQTAAPVTASVVLPIGTGKLFSLKQSATHVLVGDPNIGDAKVMSPKLFYLSGNQIGRTNVLMVDADEQVVATIDLQVVPDASAANQDLRRLDPKGEAKFDRAGERLVARGKVKDTESAMALSAVGQGRTTPDKPIANHARIEGSQQINIRVRFAEVSRNDILRIGINWEALVDSGNLLFGIASGQFFLPGGGIDFTETAGAIFGSGRFGDVNVDLLIDALQREGILNILAEPNLTAVNGERASFLAGGEIPIPVPHGDGDSITIEFKPFGVALDFLPTILPGERINLRVRPEVSELISTGAIQFEGFSIPALSVRRTETSVELASGQTLAIAGMFRRSISNDVDQLPLLGDLPILGQLFKSRRYQRDETELVILITPYLVEPQRERTAVLPTDQLGVAAGAERATVPVPVPRAKLAGFIVN
jgi:pilus assembly protein CpaC